MKLIHGIWHESTLPKEDCYVESWRRHNPKALVQIWTLEEVRLLMSDELAAHFDRMPFLLQRVNVARLVLMQRCGGIYLDLDMECLRPLNEWFERDIFFCRIDVNNLVCNAALGSRQAHPFWSRCLAEILRRPAEIPVSSDGLKTTGAFLLTDLVDADAELKAACVPTETFFPGRDYGNDPYTIHHCVSPPRWMGAQFKPDGTLSTNRPYLVKK